MLGFTWGSNLPACPADIPRIPENPRAVACRICDDFLCQRRCNGMRIPSTSCNPIFNLIIHRRGDDWEGPVNQYFLLRIYVASVRKLSIISVANVSNCLQIVFRVAFCVICIC